MAAIEQKTALSVTGASFVADISSAIVAYPILGFLSLGCIGGLSGAFLAQEAGTLDTMDRRGALCFFARRIILGMAIGVTVYVGWADQSQAPGLWLLATGIISTSPVEMVRKVVEVAQSFLARKAGEK
jgi:hypothetical protein